MNKRFTIDGSAELERRLGRICDRVRREVAIRLPKQKIAAIVLGGGYGRGEGGVLKNATGESPYNDLEFYVFVRSHRLWNEFRHTKTLHDAGEELSKEAGVHVEFKIDCAERWKKGPPSMFSYDLTARNRMIFGDETLLQKCSAHLDAAAIPLSEATRLMFNRCSGLLLARALLLRGHLAEDEADFVVRNLAKMQLALGDAALTGFGQYHWSARERHRRLACSAAGRLLPWWTAVEAEHAAGLEFKLHPRQVAKNMDEFLAEHRRLTALALQVWLWLERLRLEQPFSSATEYALSGVDKCPEMPAWRNCLVNVRAFGVKTLKTGAAWRYPRARLFNVLTLLLWNAEETAQRPLLGKLQEDLQTDALDWAGLVNAFKQIWPRYG